MSDTSQSLRLGTRGSLLARAQSRLIADELMRRHAGLRIELITITTTGDVVTDRPLNEIGGKGLFTKELEQALLRGEIDFAVHSFKDVPVTEPLIDPAELMIAAVPPREDPADVLVSLSWRSLKDLPAGAVVGTSSLRRRAQVLAARPDVTVVPLRGNIDTRIRKLRERQFDAMLLALAGVKRAGLFDPAIMTPLGDEVLPAAGQGALALQCRRDDERTRSILAALDDPVSRLCVEAERAIVLGLRGDCHSPIAAAAIIAGELLTVRARVAGRDGNPPVIGTAASGPRDRAQAVVDRALSNLLDQGAETLLHLR
jgi:hydroxymethylbilane synthase